MSNEIYANEMMFTKRAPIYGTSENFTGYPQDTLRGFVSFQAAFTEGAQKKLYDRSGTNAPFDPSNIETYVHVFCNKKAKTVGQSEVYVYTFFGDDDEKAVRLLPDEAEAILAQYNNPQYGSAFDYVKKQEKIHGDKVKIYASGSEYSGNFAADLAAIAATHSSWKKNSSRSK